MSKLAENGRLTAVGGESPTDGGNETVAAGVPYVATVRIEGVADLLFHRWNCEGVEAKSKAAKGSKAKKTDDVESYVYRDEEGVLCLPGEYLRQAVIHAAKFRQDPRSPRKSAMDLFKAAICSLTPLAPLYGAASRDLACQAAARSGVARSGMAGEPLRDWDYLDRRRVVVQRNAVTRERPALRAGWGCEVQLMVNLPEYVAAQTLLEVINQAGKLVGVGDFRPTYGRFSVTSFAVGLDD